LSDNVSDCRWRRIGKESTSLIFVGKGASTGSDGDGARGVGAFLL
jgi:hypothetical protein